MDGALHEDAAARAAILPAVVEDRVGRCGPERFEVRIGVHDVGALAAQLQADLLHVARGQPHDFLAGPRLARECHLGDAWMSCDGCACRASGTGHDVDNARRQTGLERQLAEPDGGHRGVARGLEDARVAGSKSRAQLPGGHVHREVPGHDQADDPDGLSERQVKARPADGDRLTEDLVGSSGVVLEDQAHSQGLAAGRRDRLANVLF